MQLRGVSRAQGAANGCWRYGGDTGVRADFRSNRLVALKAPAHDPVAAEQVQVAGVLEYRAGRQIADGQELARTEPLRVQCRIHFRRARRRILSLRQAPCGGKRPGILAAAFKAGTVACRECCGLIEKEYLSIAAAHDLAVAVALAMIAASRPLPK